MKKLLDYRVVVSTAVLVVAVVFSETLSVHQVR